MSTGEKLDISTLRTELARVAKITDAAERTLEVVAIIESVAAPMGIHPVLVGGMAVYFWTENEAFLSHDIDVIMEVPDSLARTFAELGFARGDARHWELPGSNVFLEAPSADLDQGAVVVEVELSSGRQARVLSRVDVLIDRLDEFQATGHEVAAQQVFQLLSEVTEDERHELGKRASDRRVTAILKRMQALLERVATGGETPDSGELHEIARAALNAEYHSHGL
ncbi:MAG TPA: hypothetical protein VIC05_09130 [Solirubrobacteraceae bacterium]